MAEQVSLVHALESSHAIAHAIELARGMPSDSNLVINLSGRGDKDVQEVARLLEARQDS